MQSINYYSAKRFLKKISLSFSGHNVIGATCSMLTWAVRYETPAAGVTQDSTSGRGTTLSVCPTECVPWGTVRRTMVSNYGILNSSECWLFYRRLICQTCPIFVVHFCPRMYFCPRCLFCPRVCFCPCCLFLPSCLFLSSLSIFAPVSVSALVFTSVLYLTGNCEDCHKRNAYSDRADTVQRCLPLKKWVPSL